MLVKAFLVVATAVLASAGPLRARQDGAGCIPRPPKGTPTLPVNGGGPSELAAAPSNLVLKHIVLGHGIQNYTCVPGATPTPSATGALAVLYDITKLYPGQGPDSLSQAAFDGLSSVVLHTRPVPLNPADPLPYPNAASSNPFPAPAALELPNLKPIPVAGHHIFDSAGVPTFIVGAELFKGGKLDGINAPPGADKGTEGTGAVAWLQLGDKGASIGITMIYRVITAGGVAHACPGGQPAAQSVPYATHYWMYGPKP